MTMQELEKYSSKYSPKQGLNYAVLVDKHGSQIEEPSENECCDDCLSVMKAAFERRFQDGDFKWCKKATAIEVFEQYSPESDDFTSCTICGEIIETGVLHTFSQEAEHWLTHYTKKKLIREIKTNPQTAWIIHEILSSEDFVKRHPKERELLAQFIDLH